MAFQNITGLQWASLGPDALQVLQIDNEFCTAQVALQGAQVLQFYSKQHQRDVLWLSDRNSFAAGKAIRGGIPLCFPWFGAHAIETDYPHMALPEICSGNSKMLNINRVKGTA